MTSFLRRALLSSLVLVASSALAVHDPPSPPVKAPEAQPPAPVAGRARTNLLFVSFDTLRRDHVSCYGHDRLTTPVIDSLAREGMLFTDAQGVIPLTGPSHATMFTGHYPQVHGAFRNGVKMPASQVTLAEMLAEEGYRTGAVVSGWTLRDVQCNLGQGFAWYDDAGMDERYNVVNLMRRADAVTDSAISWFDQGAGAAGGQPWFLFVHYFDPHEPYDLKERIEIPENPARKDLPRGYAHRQRLADYDNEIAFADRELGRLLSHLRAKGALENTLVVFTADHGQSFGDNGYGGPEGAHGRKVYQSQVAVPLIFALPGRIPAGSVNDLPVSHVDLVPTIIELLGVPVARVPAGLPGASLARVAQDPSAPAPWGRARRTRHGLTFAGSVGNKWNIFRWAQNKDVERAEPLHGYVLTDDGRKVVVDFGKKPKVEIYDLKADPLEQRNLAGQAVPEEAAVAQGEQVLAWYDRTRAGELSAPAPTAEDLEKLRALGYVE